MLGLILSPLGQEVPGQYPNEVAYTGTGAPYLCPPDPQFNTRGEAGWYYDSPLGGISGLGAEGQPTDAELATVYGYTPWVGGWINAAEGYFPSNWIPPGNYSEAGTYGPQPSLSGLHDYNSCAAACNPGSSNLSACLDACSAANPSTASPSVPTWVWAAAGLAGLGLVSWWAFKKPMVF
jgi:hypothetical protein